ncbi:MAG: hypothetical protein DRQ49_19335 [Gammaproteobacteria bacterium]|nr:MAG: hypothetical protein DRQ49_19335 [Gammaproteobacteria bacterium]
MAVAGYTTDLTTLDDFEGATTDSEFTGYTATSKPDDSDTDFPIQGNAHVSSEQRTAAQGSIAVDNGSNITWTSGWNFFLWGIFLAPAAVNTDANGGIVMMVGSSTSAFYKWTVGGNDFGRYPYGGWQNFVCNPEVTNGRTTTGSPGTNYRWCGMGCDVISAIAKGSPYGVDVIRYGRGELRVINGQAGDYGTFADMASTNDNNSNMWGLFQENSGSYLWKGLLSLGTTTSVDFRDSNRAIFIDNTRRVQPSFNRIEINHSSSNVEWTAINISALGTQSKGEFEVIDNADVSLDTCVFTDMSTFDFLSNTTLTNTTFRRCGLVTQGGATLTGCVFDSSAATTALSCDDLDLVTECTFNSDGTGHAVDLGTISSTQGITWDNTDVGYSSSVDANKTILVNVTGSYVLTISIGSNAGSTPTIYNTGTGTAVTSASVPLSISVVDSDNTPITTAAVRIEEADGTLVKQGDVNGSGVYSTTFTESTPLSVVIKVRSSSSTETRYIPVRTSGTIATTSGLVTTVTLQKDSIASS